MKTKDSTPCFVPSFTPPSWPTQADVKPLNFLYNSFDKLEKKDFSNNYLSGTKVSTIPNATVKAYRQVVVNWKPESNGAFKLLDGRALNSQDFIKAFQRGQINNSLNGGFYDLALQDLGVGERLIDQITYLISGSKEEKDKKIDDLIDDPGNPLNGAFLRSVSYTSSSKSAGISVFGVSSYDPLSFLQNSTLFCNLGSSPDISDSLILTADYSIGSFLSGNLINLLSANKTPISNDSFLSPILEDINNTGGTTKGTPVLVGKLIDKYEIDSTGNLNYVETTPVFSSNSSYNDYSILYGSSYSYQISNVYAVNLLLPTPNGGTKHGSYLFSSNPTSLKTVSCVEKEPPPPPADLNFYWDYDRSSLVLTWNMPVNPTQDIKGYGVFKRATPQEPFQLIAYYDFNDSLDPDPVLTTILESGVYKNVFESDDLPDFPVLSHTDLEFDKKSSQIYTVCSFDAHNNPSLLSAQFEISFDNNYNKIRKRLVSHSNAPMSYPNLYLLQDLFLDTAFVDGFEYLDVVFDPACPSSYKNGNNPDNKLFVKSSNDPGYNPENRYVISMINTDVQEFTSISIKIKS